MLVTFFCVFTFKKLNVLLWLRFLAHPVFPNRKISRVSLAAAVGPELSVIWSAMSQKDAAVVGVGIVTKLGLTTSGPSSSFTECAACYCSRQSDLQYFHVSFAFLHELFENLLFSYASIRRCRNKNATKNEKVLCLLLAHSVS